MDVGVLEFLQGIRLITWPLFFLFINCFVCFSFDTFREGWASETSFILTTQFLGIYWNCPEWCNANSTKMLKATQFQWSKGNWFTNNGMTVGNYHMTYWLKKISLKLWLVNKDRNGSSLILQEGREKVIIANSNFYYSMIIFRACCLLKK